MKDYHIGYVIFLALVAAGGGFLFGYDTAVISGTIGQVTQLYGLNVLQQGWYVGCALVGSILGVAAAGTLSDRLGRKTAMVVAATMFTLSAVGCALCNTFDQLVVYRIIGGVGIGVASIVCPMYISEIAITQFRGRLVSTYQLAITIGFVAAYLANYLLLQWSHTVGEGSGLWHKVMVDEVYRGMLGLETVPAFLFFVVIFLLPESPRWLIVRGQSERAKGIFGRIYRREDDCQQQVAEVAASVSSEEKSDVRYLFSPGIRVALVAGLCIAILGQFMGVNAVLYYGPKIFEDAGLSSGDSLFYQVLVGMVNMLTTVLALLIIDKVGRKQLVYYGVTGMIVSLLLIATYFSFGEAWHWSSIVMLVFFLLYVFFTAVSISAVVWVLLSEMYPTRVRGLAMSIAGFSLWIGTYLVSQLTPWLLATVTPTGTFIIFAIMCLPYLFIMWRYIPETAGRSLEEIERYWLDRFSVKQKTEN
ncbi:MAG: sugar porter family MFS transporter [Muribaculaceae bacterium]|nr:sugar porter family MFS transporter [Muribaculaceae bacterium]